MIMWEGINDMLFMFIHLRTLFFVHGTYFTSSNQINRWTFSYKHIFRHYVLFSKAYYVFSAENCDLLDCYAASSGNSVLLGLSTLEDTTERLSGNVGEELALIAA